MKPMNINRIRRKKIHTKKIQVMNAGIASFVFSLQKEAWRVRLYFCYMLLFKRFKQIEVSGKKGIKGARVGTY